MTTISYKDALSIPLLFYVPCLIASVLLIARHGWSQSWRIWSVLATFSTARIAYAALSLAAHTHPDNIGLRAAAATLAVDGLSPLLFLSLGLVHRLRGAIGRACPAVSEAQLVGAYWSRLPELLVTAALICASVGYKSLSRDEVLHGIDQHSSTVVAAAAMYVVAFAGVVLAAVQLCASFRAFVPSGERMVLLVLVAGLLLLCLRTVYLAVDVLGDVRVFSAISGDETLFLCLALLPEMVISAGYLVLGWVIPILSREEWTEMQKSLKERGSEKTEEGDGDAGMNGREVDIESGGRRSGNV